MVNTDAGELFVILVAPNVSEQMGGEAIKALHVWLELEKRNIRTHQITHERVKREVETKFPRPNISYVKETLAQRWMWKSKVFRPLLKLVFQWRSSRMVMELLKEHPKAIVHYTSPVSPVLPAFRIPGAKVVIGPVNGNIYYPRGFWHREGWNDRLRRWSHPTLQFFHRLFFHGKQSADVLLVSGGARTYQSLRWAGCREEQFVDSVDSGILDRLRELPLATHIGRNLNFVHNGRLVDHKGADLVIRAVAKAKLPVTAEIIGRGPEREKLKQLARNLGVESRITFTEWIEDHTKVATILQQFRAFVFPSLAEANGIVVQESMVLGLPVITLDWGGPALLVTPACGYLVKPTDEETVSADIAKAMDELAENSELAQRMAIAGRERAIEQGYLWSELISRWIAVYCRLAGLPASAYTSPLTNGGEVRI